MVNLYTWLQFLVGICTVDGMYPEHGWYRGDVRRSPWVSEKDILP